MSAPLRIGITCHHTLGGSGIVAAEIGLGLARLGHQIHFIGAAPPARLAGNEQNVHFHEVGHINYPLFDHSPYTLTLASKMVEVSTRQRLDVLHVHYAVPHAISAYLARQALGEAAPKVVTTVHGTDVTVVGGSPELRPMVALALAQSDHLTGPSHFLEEAAVALGLPPGRSFEVIPNFVDTERFTPAPVDRTEVLRRCGLDPARILGARVLVHVSNFRPIKRITDVIEIFDRVHRRTPAVLVMVGDGPERTAAEWRVRDRGLTGQVAFTGAQRSFVDVLRASDVFLLPSESESFGLAALEAMSCGVPVVGSATGGVAEVVLHGKTGFLAPVGDVERMAEHVVQLLGDPALHTRLSQGSRERACTEFPRQRAVERYQAAYRRLLGR
ncbi:MAG: N-acetyl-alpha-D-glucosaminyl L-malate synthase BshA [Myxococcota bacterium]|nr:N-acetyl-alpha-D-glucosaminyl L-malate synthase BshA [Myxococcota bacterium]